MSESNMTEPIMTEPIMTEPSMAEPNRPEPNRPMTEAELIQVTNDNLTELYEHFKNNSYSVPNETPQAAEALARCKAMLELDYNVVEIDNAGGVLCAHYPSRILICQSEKALPDQEIYNDNNVLNLETESDINDLRHEIIKARKGRCRARFPVPVILFDGKYVCRSGTTAIGAEIWSRKCWETGIVNMTKEIWKLITGTSENEFDRRGDDGDYNDKQTESIESSVRINDIKLLKRFKVETIFDLMVEYQKVKYGLYVSSCEQIDKENRYKDFKIVNIPYPGCEFFAEFHKIGRVSENLVFKWRDGVDYKTPSVPEDALSDYGVIWDEYKEWNIPTLTTNYLAAILRRLKESKSGILVHCISGWDRTPLFISLLRMSLWSDDLIHKSLSPMQMLYFTVAYDWMLFGHSLENRLAKNEEIFCFCFSVLKFMIDKKCSLKSVSECTASPRVSRSSDNGNFDNLDDIHGSPQSNISDATSNIPKRTESESDNLIAEYETFENEIHSFTSDDLGRISIPPNLDVSGAATYVNLDNNTSRGGNESNGNIPEVGADKNCDSLVQNSSDRSPRSNKLTRKSEDSWIYVSSGGSAHSNDNVLPKTKRGRSLTSLRNELFKIYDKIEITYKQDGYLSQFTNTIASQFISNKNEPSS